MKKEIKKNNKGQNKELSKKQIKSFVDDLYKVNGKALSKLAHE